MDNMKEVVIALIAAVSGGGLASILTYSSAKKSHDLHEIHEILEQGRIFRVELTQKIERQTEKIIALESKIEIFRLNEAKLRKEISVLRKEIHKNGVG